MLEEPLFSEDTLGIKRYSILGCTMEKNKLGVSAFCLVGSAVLLDLITLTASNLFDNSLDFAISAGLAFVSQKQCNYQLLRIQFCKKTA